MNLYPYQQKIVDQVLKNFKTVNKQMIVVPTGGGKTVIFSHIIKYLRLKTLVVAHTRELITQCERTLERLGITNTDVFSVQKCFRNLDQLKPYELLIVDECHRSGAPSYRKILDRLNEAKVIGVTATPFRHDGQKLYEIFGPKISPLNLLDMINQGFLCDFEGYRIRTNISLKGIKIQKGDFTSTQLAPVINVKNRNALIVKEYLKIAKGEKALCFAVDINHANELANEFKSHGIEGKAVHGKLPKHARKKMIEDFKSGRIQVLINCQILTEGFDEPSITCLLLARPTCSKVLYTQMIGRGSRLFPGKKVCKVIEFTDNEYDVSSIEDLVDGNVKRHHIRNGEKLSGFGKRLKKILEEEANQTFTEKMTVIPRSIYERPASFWQKKYLNDLGIKYEESITEFMANNLIARGLNG